MKRNLLWILVPLFGASAWAQPGFTADIKPLLQKQCQGCHNPSSPASDLDVTSYAAFAKGGKRGPGFVAGQPEESLNVRYHAGAMKPARPLGHAGDGGGRY